MEDNKFWISIWSLVAAVTVTLIVTVMIVNLETKAKWEKAVANGADPMAVSCALNLSNHGYAADAIICYALAQNKK